MLLLLLVLGLASSQDLQCHVPGECTGLHTGIIFAETYNECLQNCKEAPDCVYGEGDTKVCHHSDVCPSISEENCNDCYTGQKECQPVSNFNKLFVVGGNAIPYVAEIIDLASENKTCPPIPNYPYASGSFGTFIGGQAIVCGGYPYTDECYHYEPETNSWVQTFSMLSPKEGASAVQLSETEWWVTGGKLDNAPTFLASTEIYTVGQGFSPYVDLPDERHQHVVVRLDETHFMLLGDFPGGDLVWIFDRSSEEWSRVDNLEVSRFSPSAGLVLNPETGSRSVVVAGGSDSEGMTIVSTEIFDLSSGSSQEWISGPDLSVSNDGATSVQYGDGFLIVGGFSNSRPALNSIVWFDPVLGDWVELPQKLSVERYWHTAFLVPDDFVECQ